MVELEADGRSRRERRRERRCLKSHKKHVHWVRVTPDTRLYGDSMIWAGCIFSQSATGEVSSAYFRKLAISRFSGWGVQIFANGPNARLCRDTLTRAQPDMRPASTSKKPAIRGRRPKGCSKARQPMWLCLTSCCRTRGRARPVSIREYRSLDLSTHIFAITSPPGGVHIFAWLASFRNFAPKPCIFSLTTPVRIKRKVLSGYSTILSPCISM